MSGQLSLWLSYTFSLLYQGEQLITLACPCNQGNYTLWLKVVFWFYISCSGVLLQKECNTLVLDSQAVFILASFQLEITSHVVVHVQLVHYGGEPVQGVVPFSLVLVVHTAFSYGILSISCYTEAYNCLIAPKTYSVQ